MKTLLVALDASPMAKTVLAEAQLIARGTGGRMVLFRAVNPLPQAPPEVLVVPPGEVADILCRNARAELEELTVSIPPELLKSVRVEVGIAASAICDAATSEQADLIVIGSHGHGLLDRVLGTTSSRVVNKANRSVLVVRPKEV